ncbi:MAG: hypothetical protein LBK42_03950 [Propionibacteriaceae bacterium]|jgi:hypothetical protein|nr:hypothetical protein [Propionibacteriaceae bacterium]
MVTLVLMLVLVLVFVFTVALGLGAGYNAMRLRRSRRPDLRPSLHLPPRLARPATGDKWPVYGRSTPIPAPADPLRRPDSHPTPDEDLARSRIDAIRAMIEHGGYQGAKDGLQALRAITDVQLRDQAIVETAPFMIAGCNYDQALLALKSLHDIDGHAEDIIRCSKQLAQMGRTVYAQKALALIS